VKIISQFNASVQDKIEKKAEKVLESTGLS
jgi:hypothetical protein